MEINSGTETESKETMLKRMIVNRMDNKIASGKFDWAHEKRTGVRSRQMMALVEVLVDCGVITEEDLTKGTI